MNRDTDINSTEILNTLCSQYIVRLKTGFPALVSLSPDHKRIQFVVFTHPDVYRYIWL